MPANRRRFEFRYTFADGSQEKVVANTPGDARAALKRRRGRLPKVLHKSRREL